jgi:Mce-associated membrane protein
VTASSDVPERRGRLVPVLATLTVLLLAASVVLALVVKSQRDDRQELAVARESALQAARQAILNLDGLSAATIDRDLARVLAQSTGTFKKQFSQAQGELKKRVVGLKAVSSGRILSAGVVRSDTDTATVLVAVDRLVKDSTNKDGVTARDRWRLDLERRGGRWLVEKLEPVA